MSDARFPAPGTDARFPGNSVDVEAPGGGVDARFPSPGTDARFGGGGGYGGYGGLIDNGDFANGGTDWTFTGSVTFPGNTVAMSGASSFSQSIVPYYVAAKYTVSYTINSISGGTLTPSVGGTNGTGRTSAGTYSEVIVAGATPDKLKMTLSAGTCVIDNIKVELYALKPVQLTAPILTGSGLTGTTLSLTPPVWRALPVATDVPSWYADGVLIAGETSFAYTVQGGDAGKTITGRCVGTNTEGSTTSSFSNGIVAATLALPVNTILPLISGIPVPGNHLVADGYGTWTGAPTPVLTGVWQFDGSDITGSTSLTSPLIVTADIGKTLRFKSTATNAAGSVSVVSDGRVIAASVTIFSKPVLIWDGNPNDLSPGFTAQLSIAKQAGNWINLRFASEDTFTTGLVSYSHQLTADEILTDSVPITVADLTAGHWYAQIRHTVDETPAGGTYTWSDAIDFTLVVDVLAPAYLLRKDNSSRYTRKNYTDFLLRA